ncbi:MAG: arginine--tRNA ligase [Flavobacterium sp. BFFFF2]|nr:MAG: arginine--tRNA ligase [Flavobacterium sp. BFFFF2]
MYLTDQLENLLIPFVKETFKLEQCELEFQQTRKEFEGDITLVLFSLVKQTRTNPKELGEKIGSYLTDNIAWIDRFSMVSGFLNLVINDSFYSQLFVNEINKNDQFGMQKIVPNAPEMLVEFASPNTNKPLHLGHLRNILLGHSIAQILEAAGTPVKKVQIINDRGIHICKSMVAWKRYYQGVTPESTRQKGDKLVGDCYVTFDKVFKEEIHELKTKGLTEDEAKKSAPILIEAQQMLLDWEQNNPAVRELWETMNAWVYEGFAVSFKRLGVAFDKNYYESDTYLLGKDEVEKGLSLGVFFKKDDGSVWIDLTEDGLDEKLVLRSDGTSVYMTQDMGTAIQRFKDFEQAGGMVYTVGNEQDYHFKVLFLILKKLGFAWAEHLFHLSYGMVELPSGKMKSREGTVVDADDLMEGMQQTAANIAKELGKLDGYSEEEKNQLFEKIGMGALKYYILKVDPKKTILFNPEESIDFNGNTGPFIQYTYARIQSLLRKSTDDITIQTIPSSLDSKEKELIKTLLQFPEVVQFAAKQYSPAQVANYVYELVKSFNSLYQTVSILGETDLQKRVFRIQLAQSVGQVIARSCHLLGMEVPERM